MELGMIGLGRMGSNMARRLLRGGHSVMVYDPTKEAGADSLSSNLPTRSSLSMLTLLLSISLIA
jgi:6-phosphogluconate dehydrogenase